MKIRRRGPDCLYVCYYFYMTNEDMLTDLKNYLDLKFDANNSYLEEKIVTRVEVMIRENNKLIRKEMDEVVGEHSINLLNAISEVIEPLAQKVENHDKDIKKLQARFA